MSSWRALAVVVAACDAFEPDLGPVVEASAPDGAEIVFGRDIRPLMDRSDTDPTGHGCKACHYSNQPSHVGTDVTGLDLSTLGGLRKGGVDTQADIVVPPSPEASALVQKLRGTFGIGVRMPKNGPAYWSEDEIEIVVRWIAQGAKGDDSE